MLPLSVIQQLPANSQALLFSKTFFPNLISAPFDDGLRIAFLISIAISVVAAFSSLMGGKRFIYEQENQPQLSPEVAADPPDPSDPPDQDNPCDDRETMGASLAPGGQRPC